MILRRLGNKKKIAAKIAAFFPPHEAYIEPFFGAGGMFFNKPRAKFNACNDIDKDVFNLFMVLKNRAEEFEDTFRSTPIDDNLFQYWKKNEETNEIWRAVRFVYLSNFGYMGKTNSLHSSVFLHKKKFMGKVKETKEAIKTALFFSCDFEVFLLRLIFTEGFNDCKRTLIYCDPPYLSTGNNYSQGFKKEDTERLFRVCREMSDKGCNVAISEFDNPAVCEIAQRYGFNKIVIGERRSMKNRSTEVLFTSYKINQLSLF